MVALNCSNLARTAASTILAALIIGALAAFTSANVINAVVISKRKSTPTIVNASSSSDPRCRHRRDIPLSFSPASASSTASCRRGGPSRSVRTSLTLSTKTIASSRCLQLRGGYSRDGGGSGRGYYDSSGRDYGGEGRGGYEYEYEDGSDKTGRSRRDEEYYGGAGQGRSNERGGYYDENGYYRDDYDNREGNRAASSYYSRSQSGSNIPEVLRNGNKKIGMALLSSGAVFTLLGISLFFNKNLLRMGNFLFVAGIPMTIGPGRTAGYFLQPKKARATACLIGGMFLVLIGWPIFGMALEIFGLLNLFGNMFPVLMVLVKQLPIVGNLFGGNGNGGSSRKKRGYEEKGRKYDREENYYYGGSEGARQDDESADRYYY